MKLLIDTNCYSDFVRGDKSVTECLVEADRIYVPFVVLAELRAGFRCGKFSEKNEAVLSKFLSNPRVEVLYADSQTPFAYAEIFAQLRMKGTPIPTNDIWIAALAVQHSLPLCSRDAHFANLPQIARVG